ncbi:MAG: hypothetical protein ABW252_09945 [Polyangiales bacterium]
MRTNECLRCAGCVPVSDAIVEVRAELTSEAGTQVEVSVRLSRNPRTTVVVYPVSFDESECTVSKRF